MDFFRRIILIFLFCYNFVFAFSSKPQLVDKNNFATILELDDNCFLEINEKVKTILDTKTLQLSKILFKEESHLYVTNNIEGYVDTNRIFLLHLNSKICNISLVDSSNRPLKSLQLKECNCQIGDKK